MMLSRSVYLIYFKRCTHDRIIFDVRRMCVLLYEYKLTTFVLIDFEYIVACITMIYMLSNMFLLFFLWDLGDFVLDCLS